MQASRRRCATVSIVIGLFLLIGVAALGRPQRARRAPRNDAIAPGESCRSPRDDQESLRVAVNRFRGPDASCSSATRGRRRVPTPDLEWSDELTFAAEMHAQDMARWGYFSHIDRTGSGPGDRARRAGVIGPVRENLAWGAAEGATTVAQWNASPDHCETLLSDDARRLGVGHSIDQFGKHFWVLLISGD